MSPFSIVDVDCIAAGWKHEIRPLSGDGRAEKSLGSLQSSPSLRGSEEAADLLDDFQIALLELPGDAWPHIAAALPDEPFDRIDRYMEKWLAEGA